MCVVAESLLDVAHIGAAAGEDDAAQQFVGILRRYLIPYVLDDFGHTTLHNLDELTALYGAVGVDGQLQVVVDIAVVGESRCVFQFHFLSLAFLHLQRCDILGDVGTAERNDGQVAQDVLVVDRYGGGVCTQVDQCTA